LNHAGCGIRRRAAEEWIAPARRRVRHIAKSSFLANMSMNWDPADLDMGYVDLLLQPDAAPLTNANLQTLPQRRSICSR